MIFALASIVVSILGYVFIYRQTLAKANNYFNAKLEVEAENTKEQYENELVSIHSSSENDRMKLKSALVSEDRIVDFIEKLESIGVDSKTVVDVSSIDSNKDKVVAKISVKGSWSGVMTALMLLENLPFATSISDIRLDTIGALSGESSSGTWNLYMNIEALTIQ